MPACHAGGREFEPRPHRKEPTQKVGSFACGKRRRTSGLAPAGGSRRRRQGVDMDRDSPAVRGLEPRPHRKEPTQKVGSFACGKRRRTSDLAPAGGSRRRRRGGGDTARDCPRHAGSSLVRTASSISSKTPEAQGEKRPQPFQIAAFYCATINYASGVTET